MAAALPASAPAPISVEAPRVTAQGLRHAAGNVLLAASFFLAALPNARHFDSDLANAIWVVGAFIMGALSLVRLPAKTVKVDVGALASTAAMLVLPCMMRPTARAAGVLAAAALALEIFGVAFSQVARIYMGRSFGILPANRGIVSNGPFRIVRHPIYLGWLVLTIGYAMAFPGVRNLAVAVATVPFMLWRIALEERLLSADPEYRAYRASVRYRLIPGVV